METMFSVGGRYPMASPATKGLQIWLEPLIFTLGVPNITDAEVQQFGREPLDLYVQDLKGLMLVTAKTGIGWADGFASPESAANSKLPSPPDEGKGYELQITLADCETQIVKALRFVGLSREFSRGLYTIWMRHRNDRTLSQDEFMRKITSLMSRYGSPRELALRAPYKCQVGARA
jgi:hypothetical protein